MQLQIFMKFGDTQKDKKSNIENEKWDHQNISLFLEKKTENFSLIFSENEQQIFGL